MPRDYVTISVPPHFDSSAEPKSTPGPATQAEIEQAIDKAVAMWNGDYSDTKVRLAQAIYEGVKPFLR